MHLAYLCDASLDTSQLFSQQESQFSALHTFPHTAFTAIKSHILLLHGKGTQSSLSLSREMRSIKYVSISFKEKVELLFSMGRE